MLYVNHRNATKRNSEIKFHGRDDTKSNPDRACSTTRLQETRKYLQPKAQSKAKHEENTGAISNKQDEED